MIFVNEAEGALKFFPFGRQKVVVKSLIVQQFSRGQITRQAFQL